MLRAVDRELGRTVAIKLLKVELADDESRRRFEREARLAASVRYPHVMAVYDAGVSADGTPFLVSEFVAGQDLELRLAARPGPDRATLGRFAIELASALEAAHQAGIVHRDVKPANAMVAEDGRLVLGDFGIARDVGSRTRLTAEGMILGTPGFMAPELWMGGPASPATDQFAYGATLFAMLFGRLPVTPPDLAGFVTWARNPGAPAAPDGILPRIPELVPVALRALAPDPARRYPGMGALRAECVGLVAAGMGPSAVAVPGATLAGSASIPGATLAGTPATSDPARGSPLPDSTLDGGNRPRDRTIPKDRGAPTAALGGGRYSSAPDPTHGRNPASRDRGPARARAAGLAVAAAAVVVTGWTAWAGWAWWAGGRPAPDGPPAGSGTVPGTGAEVGSGSVSPPRPEADFDPDVEEAQNRLAEAFRTWRTQVDAASLAAMAATTVPLTAGAPPAPEPPGPDVPTLVGRLIEMVRELARHPQRPVRDEHLALVLEANGELARFLNYLEGRARSWMERAASGILSRTQGYLSQATRKHEAWEELRLGVSERIAELPPLEPPGPTGPHRDLSVLVCLVRLRLLASLGTPIPEPDLEFALDRLSEAPQGRLALMLEALLHDLMTFGRGLALDCTQLERTIRVLSEVEPREAGPGQPTPLARALRSVQAVVRSRRDRCPEGPELAAAISRLEARLAGAGEAEPASCYELSARFEAADWELAGPGIAGPVRTGQLREGFRRIQENLLLFLVETAPEDVAGLAEVRGAVKGATPRGGWMGPEPEVGLALARLARETMDRGPAGNETWNRLVSGLAIVAIAGTFSRPSAGPAGVELDRLADEAEAEVPLLVSGMEPVSARRVARVSQYLPLEPEAGEIARSRRARLRSRTMLRAQFSRLRVVMEEREVHTDWWERMGQVLADPEGPDPGRAAERILIEAKTEAGRASGWMVAEASALLAVAVHDAVLGTGSNSGAEPASKRIDRWGRELEQVASGKPAEVRSLVQDLLTRLGDRPGADRLRLVLSRLP